jgi:hypothetical protein
MAIKKSMVGWREWIGLPGLNIDNIKAKIDTGAKTCALHAFYVEPYEKGDETWVRFGIHPYQDDLDFSVECHAPLVDRRVVTDSGGHKEERYVIRTKIQMGEQVFETDMTLTDRETMKFRMLVGRNALNTRFVVDPVKSYLLTPIDTAKPNV